MPLLIFSANGASATRGAASGNRAKAMTDILADKAVKPSAVLTGSAPIADETEGMSYLQSLPRRFVTVYLPLSIILLVLLFPFYWMALTSVKPDEQLLDMDTFSPFWTWSP